MLTDKVSLVTGSGQRIGRALALRFAEEGARVVLAGLHAPKVDSVAQELRDRGGEALAVQTDITDPASVREMVQRSMERFGTIDVLVNNAALCSTVVHKAFTEISMREWNQIMSVNVTGAFLCCQAVAPHMCGRGSGRIINIASAVARRAGPWRYAHYVTSKAAIMGLTRALASELGDSGITVNAVSPGPVETGRSTEVSVSDDLQTIVAAQAIHRRATADDLVGAAVFLASDDARFITGQVINVDGGLNFN